MTQERDIPREDAAQDGGASLLALAERCEQASGPNYALDHAISLGIGRPENWHGSQLPNYTASIDAALTLVPDGWNLGQWRIIGKPDSARIWNDHHDLLAFAATPALALCAAALRARYIPSVEE